MAQSQKHPLRALSTQEERELHRVVKATSERVDVVRRASALLAVADGQTFTEAAHQADLKSGDGVGKLVVRFNEHGLAARSIAVGRGRKMTYTSAQRGLILRAVQRQPDREQDGTATWSLKTLERALRKNDLPQREPARFVRCYMRQATASSAHAPGAAPATRCASAQAAPSRCMTWKRAAQKD